MRAKFPFLHNILDTLAKSAIYHLAHAGHLQILGKIKTPRYLARRLLSLHHLIEPSTRLCPLRKLIPVFTMN